LIKILSRAHATIKYLIVITGSSNIIEAAETFEVDYSKKPNVI